MGAASLSGCGTSPSDARAEKTDGAADRDVAASTRTFAAMPAVADDAIANWNRLRGAALPKAVADQLRISARKGFDPALLAAQLPPPQAADAAADRALASYEAAAVRLSAKLSTAGEATARREADAGEARLSTRTDRDAIVALAADLPAPERSVERAVAARWMLAALEAVNGGPLEDMRAADAARLADGASEMIAGARRPAVDHADGLPPLGIQREAAHRAARRVLLELAPADIAAFRAHYGSPGGRARGRLLVAALAAADDQAGRAMLLDFFTAVRKLPPEAFR